MTDEKIPSPEKILDRLPADREPYILANLALHSGDMEEMVNALGALESAHTSGVLRPPLPSVHYATIKEAIDTTCFTEAINANNILDERGVKVLLATVIDFGNVRYTTDPPWQQSQRDASRGHHETVRVRPNPPIIPGGRRA
jgi:hypothetical protein